jgi:hypothetical protein
VHTQLKEFFHNFISFLIINIVHNTSIPLSLKRLFNRANVFLVFSTIFHSSESFSYCQFDCQVRIILPSSDLWNWIEKRRVFALEILIFNCVSSSLFSQYILFWFFTIIFILWLFAEITTTVKWNEECEEVKWRFINSQIFNLHTQRALWISLIIMIHFNLTAYSFKLSSIQHIIVQRVQETCKSVKCKKKNLKSKNYYKLYLVSCIVYCMKMSTWTCFPIQYHGLGLQIK